MTTHQSQAQQSAVRDNDAVDEVTTSLAGATVTGRTETLAISRDIVSSSDEDNGLEDGELPQEDSDLRFISREIIEGLDQDQAIVNELPKDLEFPHDEAWLYPAPVAKTVYGDYRGQDKPTKESLTVYKGEGDDKKARQEVGSNTKVMLYFNDLEAQIGALKGADSKTVKLTWVMNSQVPGLQLQIDRNKDEQDARKRFVHVKIHVNSIQRVYDGDSAQVDIHMYTSRDTKLTERLDRTGLKTGEKDRDGLWETQLSIYSRKQCDEGASTTAGPKPCPPEFYGMTNAEVDELIKRAERKPQFGELSDNLTPGDWAIIGLATTADFSIFRFWDSDSDALKVFDYFNAYMSAALTDAAFGNFPHYRRQADSVGKKLTDRSFRIRDTVPPRHLVKKWRVTYAEANPGEWIAVSAKPEEWRSFEPMYSYPDSESKAFALRLGTERSRDYQIFDLQQYMDVANGRITAKFSAVPNDSSLYWVDIVIDDSRKAAGYNPPKPDVGTRVELTIHGQKFDGLKLRGVVQDDIFHHNPDFACLVRGKPSTRLATVDESLACMVHVELIDDGTPCDRQNAALIELGLGLERTEGVDLPSLVLRSTPTVKAPESLAQELLDEAFLDDELEEILGKTWSLNDNQRQIAELSAKSKTGAILIHGPPGTGKSRTEMAIAHLHVRLGRLASVKKRQILATAPTNDAVDAMIQTLLSNPRLDLKKDGIRICRFLGASGAGKTKTKSNISQQRAEKDRDDDLDPDAAAEDAIWELVEMQAKASTGVALTRTPQYLFQTQLREWVKDLTKDRSHPLHGQAKYFRQLKNDLFKAAAAGDQEQLAKVRKELDANESLWAHRWFEQVDIVFATNSSAAHEVLMQHFTPTVFIGDEAAMASTADIATPMAAHKESIKLAVMGGDHQQLGPSVLSRGANEALPDCKKALFFELMSRAETDARFDSIMLREQHRMKPIFSAPLSKWFYHGLLTDHPSLLQEDPLETQLIEWLSVLRPYWNGRLRVAFDISGPGIYEEAVTTSYRNYYEAQAVVGYIQFLYEGAIDLNRILVITGYKPQKLLILEMLIQKGLTAIPGQKVRVATTGTVQGGENDIVLRSWVRHHPDKPLKVGFAKDAHRLCVEQSRVKFHQVDFGNFKKWAKLFNAGDTNLVRKKSRLATFGAVIGDYAKEGDILSYEHLKALCAGQPPNAADDIRPKLLPTGRDSGRDSGVPAVRPAELNSGPGFQARPDMTKLYRDEQAQSARTGSKRKKAALPEERLHRQRPNETQSAPEDGEKMETETG